MWTKTLLPTVLALMLCACSPGGDPALHANKELVVRFNEAVNAADWSALETLVADDFVRHSVASVGPPVTSREGFVELQKGFLDTFPDQRVEIDYLIAERDRVAVRATYFATQAGPMGPFPASGETVTSPFLAQFRIESGRIAEMWVEWDNLALLGQLGHYPPGEVEDGDFGPATLDAIAAADQAYADAWLAGDEASIMATLTPDAVLMPSGVPALQGEEAIRAFWFPEGAPPTVVSEFDLVQQDVAGAGDQGHVRGTFTLTFEYDGNVYHNRGDYLAVLERGDDGEWRIDQRAWNDLESP